MEVAVTPKAYLSELDAQVDQERELGKKPFDRDDDAHKGGGAPRGCRARQTPESGQQSRDGKPNGFYYSEHRTVDSKHVIVNVHVEAANINDVTPMRNTRRGGEKTREAAQALHMGLDAGYHNAWIAHLLETKGIQG